MRKKSKNKFEAIDKSSHKIVCYNCTWFVFFVAENRFWWAQNWERFNEFVSWWRPFPLLIGLRNISSIFLLRLIAVDVERGSDYHFRVSDNRIPLDLRFTLILIFVTVNVKWGRSNRFRGRGDTRDLPVLRFTLVLIFVTVDGERGRSSRWFGGRGYNRDPLDLRFALVLIFVDFEGYRFWRRKITSSFFTRVCISSILNRGYLTEYQWVENLHPYYLL